MGPTNRPKSPATILPARGNIGMQRYIFMQQPPFRGGYQVEDIKRYAFGTKGCLHLRDQNLNFDIEDEDSPWEGILGTQMCKY